MDIDYISLLFAAVLVLSAAAAPAAGLIAERLVPSLRAKRLIRELSWGWPLGHRDEAFLARWLGDHPEDLPAWPAVRVRRSPRIRSFESSSETKARG